jgi:hypothetical protein
VVQAFIEHFPLVGVGGRAERDGVGAGEREAVRAPERRGVHQLLPFMRDELGAQEQVVHGQVLETTHAQLRRECADEIEYALCILFEEDDLPGYVARKTRYRWRLIIKQGKNAQLHTHSQE